MKNYRRQLLPWWIKFFCWFFMITGLLSIVLMVVTVTTMGLVGVNLEMALYGFDAQQGSLIMLLIFFTFLFNGFAAYMLWLGKKLAIKICLINAIWGMLLCLISMILSYYNSDFKIRLELVLLILFFIKIKKIKSQWENEYTPEERQFLER
jgi:multisubunit Na+/H+ antiporter MnhF subunit